ncbi:integrase core domain-containing protein [Xanthomonas campestris]
MIVQAYAHYLQLWLIQPGKQKQNAHVESFNGRLHDELLKES